MRKSRCWNCKVFARRRKVCLVMVCTIFGPCRVAIYVLRTTWLLVDFVNVYLHLRKNKTTITKLTNARVGLFPRLCTQCQTGHQPSPIVISLAYFHLPLPPSIGWSPPLHISAALISWLPSATRKSAAHSVSFPAWHVPKNNVNAYPQFQSKYLLFQNSPESGILLQFASDQKIQIPNLQGGNL